jgi:hypothetical protein
MPRMSNSVHAFIAKSTNDKAHLISMPNNRVLAEARAASCEYCANFTPKVVNTAPLSRYLTR